MRPVYCTILLALVASSSTVGQGRSPWSLSLLAGASSYDLSGTGTTFAAAGHVAWQWKPALVLEPGVTYFHYRYATILFPEVSLQAMVPRGPVRPYFGVGAGQTIVVDGGGGRHLSLHTTLGLRVPVVRDTWGIRGELRVRSPQQWGAVTADWMFGLTRRF